MHALPPAYLPDPGRMPAPGETILLDADHELSCRECTCCPDTAAQKRTFMITNSTGTVVVLCHDWRWRATARGWRP